ncbi:MAG: 6-bladed beta-propeller [Candidatus Eisenbacteria sp.]|nr:6-bladed beta-propeller [Candidatus Eisenbacteria bacterium]
MKSAISPIHKPLTISLVLPFAGIILFGLVLVMLIPALASASKTEMIDGATHIKNGDKPTHGIETWQLEELWTAGGLDDESVLFGIITQVEIGDDNNIYLLDNQLSQVQVYSPEGELLRTLGGPGEGPGEVTNPAAMTVLPNGNIGLVKAMPGKLIRLDSEGTPLDDFIPAGYEPSEGGISLAIRCYGANNNLIFGGMKLVFDAETSTQTRDYHIRCYAEDQTQISEYYTKNVLWDFRNFVMKEIDTDFPWQRLDVADDGSVYMSPERYGYDIHVFQPDGTLAKVISREYQSYERDQAMKDLVDRAFQRQMESPQMPPNSSYEAEAYEPDIANLRVAANGDIWVHNSRQQWASEPGQFNYDVFNSDGEFIKEVRIECGGSAKDDRLFFARDDRIYKVSGFLAAAISAQGLGGEEDEEDEEAEVMAITAYRRK